MKKFKISMKKWFLISFCIFIQTVIFAQSSMDELRRGYYESAMKQPPIYSDAILSGLSGMLNDSLALNYRGELSYYIAEIYNNRSLHVKEIKYFKNALLYAYSDSSFLYSRIGLSYFLMKKFDNAISNYNKAIELQSKNGNLYFNIGHSYRENQQLAKAIYNFNLALRNGYREEWVYDKLYKSLIESDVDVGKIKEICENNLSKYGPNLVTLYYLVKLQCEAVITDECREYFNKLKELDKDYIYVSEFDESSR
tara:strand:- start:11310 stop:12068 length:759 start_codon:yes stop_codon:yes gene_type:complete